MISIVLPTYNGEKYLVDSIESIIKQSYTDWELLIVNDCSTDNTRIIAEHYAKLDQRITVINNEENMKLPASLNIGFSEAKGDYFTWTSDDNEYYDNALETMKIYLDNHPRSFMVCAAMDMMDENGNLIGISPKYDRDRMLYNNLVGACFLYRSEVNTKIGGYDVSRFCAEDYDYWLRVIDTYGDIDYIGKKLYAYRIHQNSLTGTKWKTIKRQLNELRTQRFDRIFERLSDQRDYLSGIYFDMIITNSLSSEMEQRLVKRFPIISLIKTELTANMDCIVYGAGEFGDRVYGLIPDRIVYYADRDKSKVGKIKNGLPIISRDELVEKSDKYQIVVAVGSLYTYEVVEYLISQGVSNITTFQHLMRDNYHEV